MFSLKLFGGVSLDGDGTPLTGPAVQRHRLALLALLATARPRALTRDKLMAWLWPERDAERARGLLNQAVHVLRRSLGEEAILSAGEELQLNPAVVACDVVAFEEAVSAGALERAASLYAGPFLDGFFLADAPEFERWAERERQRLATSYSGLVESLAEKAEAEKDWRKAVDWWKARVAQDPYDSRAVTRLMLALEASGNRAAAMLQAATHQRLLQEDLGLEPSPEVQALAERLRVSPGGNAPWLSVEPASSSPNLPPHPEAVSRIEVPASRSGDVSSPRSRLPLRYAAAVVLLAGAGLVAVRLSSNTARPATVANTISVDEIAQAVAREIARRERGDTAARLPQQRTRSVPAYELYLRGSDPTLLRSDSAALLALDYFRQAIALDSTYAAAWAGFARLTMRARGFTGDQASRGEAQATAVAAVRKAIALDDSLAEAHATLGLVRMLRHDLHGAEAALRHALELDPAVAQHREWLVKLYIWSGRPAEALAEAQRALQLTPLSPTSNAEVARALLVNGRCDEALVQLERLAGLQPPLARVAGIRAQCYVQKRMWGEAIAAARPKSEQAALQASGLYGYALAGAGRREEASQVLTALLDREQTRGGLSLEIALVYLGLGDLDRAVPWLDKAADDASLSALSERAPLVSTFLDSLSGDPRIAQLRRRLGLPNP